MKHTLYCLAAKGSLLCTTQTTFVLACCRQHVYPDGMLASTKTVPGTSSSRLALQVALAPAKTRAQAANATAVYDLSKDGVLAANNSAAYKSANALPFHVANIPDASNTSSGADSSMSAISQGPPAVSAAAGSLGALIQVRTL